MRLVIWRLRNKGDDYYLRYIDRLFLRLCWSINAFNQPITAFYYRINLKNENVKYLIHHLYVRNFKKIKSLDDIMASVSNLVFIFTDSIGLKDLMKKFSGSNEAVDEEVDIVVLIHKDGKFMIESVLSSNII